MTARGTQRARIGLALAGGGPLGGQRLATLPALSASAALGYALTRRSLSVDELDATLSDWPQPR